VVMLSALDAVAVLTLTRRGVARAGQSPGVLASGAASPT
jgi:hypothetical protein